MVATFAECVEITHWLLHTSVQIFFRLLLVHKIVWCSLSFSSIQTGVLAVTFHITLLTICFSSLPICFYISSINFTSSFLLFTFFAHLPTFL